MSTSVKARFLRLYHGETTIDFIGRTRKFFLISAAVVILGLVSLGVRGLNLGIDFKGGTAWEVIGTNQSVADVTRVVEAAGATQPTVYILGGSTIHIEADLNALSPAELTATENGVAAALSQLVGKDIDQVSVSTIGPTWGGQVTAKARLALIVFLIAVVIYISLRFEPKMAIAALVAMLHDLLVTLGVYSLFGFQITPDTVIALLTILGYSLYDTVVVFDRVRDNSKNALVGGGMTYSGMVNLSMNQTLARSLNTSLVAVIPVMSVLFVGAELLGATTLREYGLALFIGLMSGAYSSIFIASPLLALLKEREPRMKELRLRLETKAPRQSVSPADAARAAGPSSGRTPGANVIQPKARKQKRR